MRKKIHELICGLQQQSHKCSFETILKDLNELFSSGCSDADALTDNETLREYLHILKTFTEELFGFLVRNKATEEPANYAPASEATNDESKGSSSGHFNSLFKYFSRVKQASSYFPSANNGLDNILPTVQYATVTYKMVVSGKTLGKHLDVVKRLNGPVPGHSVCLVLKESQPDEDSQVTIVFCPVALRTGTDVDAALQDISSDKPVILVVMYQMHTPTTRPSPKTDSRVQLGVNVFFHETVGLLNCSQNDEAINEIKNKLWEYSSKKSCVNPQ